ncbi:MAG: DNA cytosine methyltransferase [Clostridiales bacterium]|nr:DNA cytosine methyltransferase [Clostridiales bacterium]
MAIRFFDMFSGIGGFRSGLEAIGGFECVGHCEIDKQANQAYCAMYDVKQEEVYFNDATKIDPKDVPDIDLICAGFPCQSFSIAGRRRGFDDVRGTLFFEIARIAAHKRPAYLLLENVPGLLSHNRGWTFTVILNALSELGYDVVWQVCNSKDFGVPQSRKRVYLICYLREKCTAKIFSFHGTNAKTPVQVLPGRSGSRVYSPVGVGITLVSNVGGFGGKTGLYDVNSPVKIKTEDGYALGYHFIDMNCPPNLTDEARCITARQNAGISNRKGEHSGIFIEDEPRAILTPERETVRQQGRRIKDINEPMFTLTVCDRHGILRYGKVRRLMPIECWRLQGFTDEQFYKAEATGLKDGPLYKMAGNAVSVPVISALGEIIKKNYEKYNK